MSLNLSLSVVIPVLDNKKMFKSAIESILQQPYQVEIIVIDGGSDDGTLDLIDHYSNEISYWESGKDKGISDAFNRGIRQASGELVAILNSDDYWEPDTLENLSLCIDQDNKADIYCGAIRYHDHKTQYQYIRLPKLEQLKRKMYVFHPSTFVRKACYESVGPYLAEYTHAMDAEWIHRAMSHGKRIATTDSVLANMALGGVSDQDYRVSLSQYRQSLIKHNICSAFEATYYYYLHLVQKKLMRNLPLSLLKRCKDKLLAQGVD